MKLYSVYKGDLIVANVIRETALFYLVDNAIVNNFFRRVEKAEVDLPVSDAHKFVRLVEPRVATTPEGAWRIVLEKAQQAQERAKRDMESATNDEREAAARIAQINEAKEG